MQISEEAVSQVRSFEGLKMKSRWSFLKPIIAILLLIWTFFPIYWLLTLSIRGSQELQGGLNFFPQSFSNEHFIELFTRNNFSRALTNSAIVTGISLLIGIVTGVSAAYILIRNRFRFHLRKASFFWILLLRILPPIAFAVPLFFVFNSLQLEQTRIPILMVHLLLNLPLIIWFMMTAIDGLPESVDESARIDGASEWQLYRMIILPQALPAVAAVGMLSFMYSWNEYLYGVIFLQNPSMATIPLLLSTMNSEQELTQWGRMAAGGVLSMIPVLIFVVFAQRYLVQGLSSGAVKE